MDTLFGFKKSCFLYGSEFFAEPDSKHPSRWNKKQGVLYRTADRGKEKQSFKDVPLQVIFVVV